MSFLMAVTISIGAISSTKSMTVWIVSQFECMWHIYPVITKYKLFIFQHMALFCLFFLVWFIYFVVFLKVLSPATHCCDLQLDLDWIWSDLKSHVDPLFEPAEPGILDLNHARMEICVHTPAYKSFIFSSPQCSYHHELSYTECENRPGKALNCSIWKAWDLCTKSIRKKEGDRVGLFLLLDTRVGNWWAGLIRMYRASWLWCPQDGASSHADACAVLDNTGFIHCASHIYKGLVKHHVFCFM